jgi:DNA adenine methylase
MTAKPRPLLKWAGGKTQLLDQLAPFVPGKFDRYVEPMIGGGAMLMSLAPEKALIADSNPELINFYRTIVSDLDEIMSLHGSWPFEESFFYELRARRFEDLAPVEAAARTLYLNRTCFNGLYRVNRSGHFNVPWGGYQRPFVIDRAQFALARDVLSKSEIMLGDFRQVLTERARAGDFIFLDPPYVPVSQYADFKRYTRDQFSERDHEALAALVKDLSTRGCDILITNSNHPLVHSLFSDYRIEIVKSKRNVNSNGAGRTGEDVVIYVPSAATH